MTTVSQRLNKNEGAGRRERGELGAASKMTKDEGGDKSIEEHREAKHIKSKSRAKRNNSQPCPTPSSAIAVPSLSVSLCFVCYSMKSLRYQGEIPVHTR